MRGEFGPVNLRDLLGDERYRAEVAELESEDRRVEILAGLSFETRRAFLRNPGTPAQIAAHSVAEVFLAGLYNCGARTIRRRSVGSGDE